jgi:hypothetical protein
MTEQQGLYDSANILASNIKADQTTILDLVQKQNALTVQMSKNETVAFLQASSELGEDGKAKWTNDKQREARSAAILSENSDHQALLARTMDLAKEKRLREFDLELGQALLKNAQLELRRQGRDTVVMLQGVTQ